MDVVFEFVFVVAVEGGGTFPYFEARMFLWRAMNESFFVCGKFPDEVVAGVETLYGSQIKQPTIFYKKDDPTPYKYPDDLR